MLWLVVKLALASVLAHPSAYGDRLTPVQVMECEGQAAEWRASWSELAESCLEVL